MNSPFMLYVTAACFGNKVTSISVLVTEAAQAALTAGRFPSREESWGLQHFGKDSIWE